jgi:hypothetical protein
VVSGWRWFEQFGREREHHLPHRRALLKLTSGDRGVE